MELPIEKKRPSKIQIVGWALTTLLTFIILLYVGNFGNFLVSTSPQSSIIASQMQLVYILSMAVLSIFWNALIWIVIIFRDKGEGVGKS
ncbi:hypothetical protein HRbin06_01068 [archaeon HR06]|nr:hypothetical protein HRbin06_01068 [archaeon HR06]